MSNAVLNYFPREVLSAGFRIETDGPATRLYRAAPPQWPRIVAAVACFVAVVLNTGLLLRVVLRIPLAIMRVPLVTGFILEISLENLFFLAAGGWQLLWHYRWGRTSRVLEATPDGLTDWRPGFFRLRTRFIPKDRIKQFQIRRRRGVIPGFPDRLTLVVHLHNSWLPRLCELTTGNIDEARHVRDILAASLGLS